MLGQFMGGVGFGAYGLFGGIDPFASIRAPISRFQNIQVGNVAAANSALTQIASGAATVQSAPGMSAAAKSAAGRLANTARSAKGRNFNEIGMAFKSLNNFLRNYDSSRPGGETVSAAPAFVGPPAPGEDTPTSEGSNTTKIAIVALVLVTLAAAGWYISTQMV